MSVAVTACEVESFLTHSPSSQNKGQCLPTFLYGKKDNYKICNTVLGTGTFSSVRLGLVNNNEKQRVAIKIVNKKTALDTSKRVIALRKEIEILYTLADHPNIVHLIEVLEDANNVYLVFEEHVGDLQSYLVNNGGKVTEQEVLHIFPQIVSAVRYCHEKGVVHRDVKLENILYSFNPLSETKTGKDLKLCLADFGFATFYDKETINTPGAELLNKWCGSPFTVAPEIINRTPYLPEPVDVWSMGSLLYTLICGYPPFKAKTLARVFRRAQKGKVKSFPKNVGICSRTLIKRMLTVEVDKRIKLDKIQDHSFFKYATMKQNDERLKLKQNDERLKFQSSKSAPLLESHGSQSKIVGIKTTADIEVKKRIVKPKTGRKSSA